MRLFTGVHPKTETFDWCPAKNCEIFHWCPAKNCETFYLCPAPQKLDFLLAPTYISGFIAYLALSSND